ncbi:hypothetical protein [Celeribacter sp.]|uniref:hypothetical protein n=1 Tax=Celeribacter sp. TaxID=1890673 RepID=UPI003A910D12
MYSWKLVEWHFWLALAGTVIYVFAMWNSGIIQGLMWRTTPTAARWPILSRTRWCHASLLRRTACAGRCS